MLQEFYSYNKKLTIPLRKNMGTILYKIKGLRELHLPNLTTTYSISGVTKLGTLIADSCEITDVLDIPLLEDITVYPDSSPHGGYISY